MMAKTENGASYLGLRQGFINPAPKRVTPVRRPLQPLPAARQPANRNLPVRRHKERIVEKVLVNRVILISADTGSGKSSQVPQMLLEEGLGPILCTQPRRLAVVSVAKRVAEERGCALGEDVGYHIGQVNLSTTRTKIVFKTAGILFEELRTNGAAALSRYKVLILDEVHERSVESDLVLTCVKQLLPSTSVKLVLMSATADLPKYINYFKDFDRGGVVRIDIHGIANAVKSVIVDTKECYLEKVVKMLGNTPQHSAVLDMMKANFSPVEIGFGTQMLIRDLIVHLHKSHPDTSKNVLVFLPTYRTLEEQYLLLESAGEPFQLHVLHSSVDMERSILAIEASPLQQRKIILATNVAESSITISGVSFVIDLCRSLQVYWDSDSKKHQTRIVWVSKSQAKQRRGRTGRTCNGIVYRLVPQTHHVKFEEYEKPAIQLLSLRKQVLMLLCSTSKALNDPAALLRKCMNAPASKTTEAALDTLEEMNAIHADAKGKYQPTLSGQLLVSLPLSLDYSALVVRGGQIGYPRESAILAAIWDSTPNPILKPFGSPEQYKRNVENYYKPAKLEESQDPPPHSAVMLANLNAFEFWQRSFKDKWRLDLLVRRANFSRIHNNIPQRYDQEDLESDWCTRHGLSLTSLRAVAETVDVVIDALHKFRPEFLRRHLGPPAYILTDTFQHSCPAHASHGCWNDRSLQESGARSVNGHDDQDQCGRPPGHQGGHSGPGNDPSFQKSEKNVNGCTQVNGCGECISSGKTTNGNGQNRNGNGKVANVNGHNRNVQLSASKDRFVGSHQSTGNFQANGHGEVNGHAKVQGSDASADSKLCPSVPYTQLGSLRSPEVEKLLCALIIETQQGTQLRISSEFGETLGDQLSRSPALCSYFPKGMCNKGSLCLYSHSLKANPMRCKFFDSSNGCRYGDECRFSHAGPRRCVLPSKADAPNFDEPAPTIQSMLDLLPVLNEKEVFLLFGEGDFSFADALSNYVDARMIFATSLDKEEMFLQDPVLNQRVSRLAKREMQFMWNVDVTSLHSTSVSGKIKGSESNSSIPWTRVRCMLWNFPFADVDENAAEHQDLMLKFFRSLGGMMISSQVHSSPVILTLCNDQYCRWQVDRAARAAFFFLKTSVPFDVSTFGGYSPMRNNLQSPFPAQRPLVYMFHFIPPRGAGGRFSESSRESFR